MTKYAINSSDCNYDYAFFAPLVSLLWHLRGYKSIVFFVGDVVKWYQKLQLRIILERTRETGAEIYFVSEIDGVRSSTIAQVVRLFASSLTRFEKEDQLITSDMDLFVLNSWIDDKYDLSKDVQLYYSNAYFNSSYLHWPMAYINAKAKIWREIVNCKEGCLQKDLVSVLEKAPKDYDVAWNFDERFFGKKLSEWSGYTTRVQFIDRTFVKGEWRLDRSGWDEGWKHLNGSLDGVADVHLLRPGYIESNWKRIRSVLELALSPDMLKWVDDYYQEWCNVNEKHVDRSLACTNYKNNI